MPQPVQVQLDLFLTVERSGESALHVDPGRLQRDASFQPADTRRPLDPVLDNRPGEGGFERSVQRGGGPVGRMEIPLRLHESR